MSYQAEFSKNRYVKTSLATAESHHDLRVLATFLCIYETIIGECSDEELHRIGVLLSKHIPDYSKYDSAQENTICRIYQEYYDSLFSDITNWFVDIDRKVLSSLLIELIKSNLTFESYRIVELLYFVKEKIVSPKDFGVILPELHNTEVYVSDIIDRLGIGMVDNSDEILKVISELMAAHSIEVQQYIDGNEKILGFFVGRVMKQMTTKPDPVEVNRLLRIELNKLKE